MIERLKKSPGKADARRTGLSGWAEQEIGVKTQATLSGEEWKASREWDDLVTGPRRQLLRDFGVPAG